MGGGPSPEQKAAAASSAALSDKLGTAAVNAQNLQQKEFNLIQPYGVSRLQSGLPFFGAMTDATGGMTGRSMAPARAAALRSTSKFSTLPSGFRSASLRDVNAGGAEMFDRNLQNAALMNEQAKSAGAGVLTGEQATFNPVPYYNGAVGANSSIMQAPLQKTNPWASILGGVAGGAASAIPF